MDAAQKALIRAVALFALVLASVVLCLPLSGIAAPALAPTRVVSIVPAVTEMLFAIGAGPQVVGVSSFDHFPAEVETRTRVGGLIDPDIERILTLKPDPGGVSGRKSEVGERVAGAHLGVHLVEPPGQGRQGVGGVDHGFVADADRPLSGRRPLRRQAVQRSGTRGRGKRQHGQEAQPAYQIRTSARGCGSGSRPPSWSS